MTRRAAIYVRISSDPTGQGLGVARQRSSCAAKAQAVGWSVTEVYEDNDISATTGRTRPAYQRMLADLDSGRVDAVVVWDLDRPPLAETVADVARAHGTAYYRDTVDNRLSVTRTVRNAAVRPRLLAALLLLADELDLHYERAKPLAGWAITNPTSEAHKFKHECVQSVRVDCRRDGSVHIGLELMLPPGLRSEDALAVQRWIEVKLRRQMGMVEPEILVGFQNQVRLRESRP